MSIASDGAYLHGKLAAGRSMTFQTTGASAELGVGHAKLYSPEDARLGVSITVTREGLALTLPVCPQREDKLVLPLDNTGGAGTSFLWVSDTPSMGCVYFATKVQRAGGYRRSWS